MITLPDFDDIRNLISYMHDVPYDTTRLALYDAASLYGFYLDAEAIPVYADTYDKRVYEHYISHGKQADDAKEALARAMHDYCMSQALSSFVKQYKPTDVIGVMGGHNLLRTDPMYREIVLLAKHLTERGKLMVTGGGPGAMQATHVGAWLAGRNDSDVDEAMDILVKAPDYKCEEWLSTGLEVMRLFPQSKGYHSLGIPTWFYGHEPASPFATDIAKFFDNSVREDTVLTIPYGGIIYTPGSAGTVQEVFQDAVQNHYLTYGISSPMIFFGKHFWTEELPVYTLLEKMMQVGRYKNLLLTLTDNPEEVCKILLDFS